MKRKNIIILSISCWTTKHLLKPPLKKMQTSKANAQCTKPYGCTSPIFSILMLLSSEKVLLLATFSSSVFVMICQTRADMNLPVRGLEKPPHQRTNIREHIVVSKKGYEIFCVIN